MRDYELIFIVHPELDDTALQGIVDRVKGWITDAGGSVEKVEMWGKRRLAYLIRKQREGNYVFVKMQMSPTVTAELERNMRFLEPVMRFMVVAPE
ncbi:MAG TPA: 30S ribosomal protein S6 [Anaerolineaceae bacterium]|nr:30S ribosomal protein S6 [Anaerolineaceae bacterium]